MAVETFRQIDYSDETKFLSEDGSIALRQYTENLVFYANFDSTVNGTYGLGDVTATTTGTVTSENNGVFAQHLLIDDGSSYYANDNFETLTTEGTLQFRLKVDFDNAPGAQSFIRTANPVISAVPDISTDISHFGGGSLDLTGAVEKRIEYEESNITTMVQTGTIDTFFISDYTGSPSTSVMLFDFYNGTNNNNRIQIYHSTDGKIYCRLYDQSASLVVDINFTWVADADPHNISLNFDGNAGATRAFVDGTQYDTTDVSTFTRTSIGAGYVGVGSSSGFISDHYIDDFAIFNTVQFTTNYTTRTVAYVGDENDLLFYAKYDDTTDLDTGTTAEATATYPASGDYEFKIAIDGNYYTGADIVVSLVTEDTMLDVSNKIATELTAANVTITQESAGNITITADVDGETISIEAPDDGTSLITLLGGVASAVLPNGPTADTNIVEFYNGTNNNNRIIITHTTDSNILLKMYNSSNTLTVDQDFGVWSNNNITWYAFELDWNDTIGQFYIDGTLVGVFQTGFDRDDSCRFYLNAGTDNYRFDELIIHNDYQHDTNYTVATAALSEYAADDPYVDINFGSGFQEDEVTDIDITASDDTAYVVSIDDNWYYYFSNAWRASDGSYSQSTSISNMEINFSELYFDESQIIKIRVYFHSDGATAVALDEINIVATTLTTSAATLTSTVDLTSGVDLTSDQHITITTDQGTAEVDVSSGAGDIAAVTLQEIIDAINAAAVPGLATAVTDSIGHIVLQTTTTGTTAAITVSAGSTSDALADVWGFEATDAGEEATSTYFDYTVIYNWIREMLGAPIIPVELTDDQLNNCVGRAVHWYNYYREAKENLVYAQLVGDDVSGYTVPTEVGGEANIIEIIVRPRFPFAYYTGGDVNNIMSNLYLQWMFQHGRNTSQFKDFIGDYYLTLSAEADYNIILGTEFKWNFYNGKIFMSPRPDGLNVGIIYKSAVTIDEINTNVLIRNYSLGEAKQVLGTIRAAFGGSIPGGTENIQLRGEALIAEGKQEVTEALESMKKLSEPFFLEWG